MSAAKARAILGSQSGGQTLSASMTAHSGARATVTPAALALTAPSARSMTTRALPARATAAVPSVEQLSTTMSSTGRSPSAAADAWTDCEAAPEATLLVVRGDDDRDVGRAIH